MTIPQRVELARITADLWATAHRLNVLTHDLAQTVPMDERATAKVDEAFASINSTANGLVTLL